jgi:hypothetical protein
MVSPGLKSIVVLNRQVAVYSIFYQMLNKLNVNGNAALPHCALFLVAQGRAVCYKPTENKIY